MTQSQEQKAAANAGGVAAKLAIKGKVAYMEIPALDVEASAAFYAKVFGWSTRGDARHKGFNDASGDLIGAWTTANAISSEPGVLPYIYVDDVRAIGATPVLVTSLVRRLYKEDGTMRTTQTPYVETVRALADEKQVPLVDLHAISLTDAESAGDDVWADLSPRDDKGQVDRTHLNTKGSEVVGRMVVEALRKAVPELASMLRLEAAPDR